MNISELKTLADLANLRLTDGELAALEKETDTMMAFFSTMKEADAAAEALRAGREKGRSVNRSRRDERTEDVSPDVLLERAAELEDRFIVIPNVL